ncbi:MAG: hypothetical protein HRF45_00085 [Fimbriimonadia bacterium]
MTCDNLPTVLFGLEASAFWACIGDWWETRSNGGLFRDMLEIAVRDLQRIETFAYMVPTE